MLKTIEQSEFFPVAPAELFRIFIDAKKHAAMTGAPAVIQGRPGGEFRAFDGLLTGTILAIVPNRLIVQQWRSCNFKKDDIDSTLILKFTPERRGERRGCRIDLVHVNVAKHDHAGVTKGWKKYYWTPLRKYLKSA